MKVGLVALHYPRPEHWDEMISRVHRAAEVMAAARTLGRLDAATRLGGYSLVTAEDIDGAAALAEGCPALRLGGGVEIGAVPQFTGNPQAGTDA
jgi:hypothetical protein